MTSPKRWAVITGSCGLAAGLALGVTGFASAADPSPSPGTTAAPGDGMGMGHGRGHGLARELRKELGRGPGGGGLVSAVSASSLTVRTPQGTKTVALNGSTAYYEGATKATSAAVDVGDIVRVRLVDPRATSPVAAVVTVVPAHLAGWVTKVDGATLTVTDVSGFTRTVRTSGATTYRKDGAASTAADVVKVGAFVHARGTVADDGSTLLASVVGTGRPERGMPHGDEGMPPGQEG